MKLTLLTLFVCLFTVLVFFTPFGIMIKERIANFDLKALIENGSRKDDFQVSPSSSRRSPSKPAVWGESDVISPTPEDDKSTATDETQEVIGSFFGHDSPFGMTVNVPAQTFTNSSSAAVFAERYLSNAKKSGAKIVRIPVIWTEIEPRRPTFRGDGNWWSLDLLVRSAESHGLDILLRLDTLRYSDCGLPGRHWPGWRYGCPKDGVRPAQGEPRFHQTGLPEDTETWMRFVSELAGRYGASVKYYQVGNEVDSDGTWAGTKEEYVSLLSLTKEALYRQDKSLLLLHAGVLSGTLRMKMRELRGENICAGVPAVNCTRRKSYIAFTDHLLRYGRTIPGRSAEADPIRFGFDISDVHIYESTWEVPELLTAWKKWLSDTAPKESSAPHFWVTETGGPVYATSPVPIVKTGPFSYQKTDEGVYRKFIKSEQYQSEQFRELVTRHLVMINAGVEKVFWFTLVDLPGINNPTFRYTGLLDSSWADKGILAAYRLLSESLEDRTSLQELAGLPVGIVGYETESSESQKLIFLHTKSPNDTSRDAIIRIFGGTGMRRLLPNGYWVEISRLPEGHLFTIDQTPLVLQVPDGTVVNF